MNSRERFLKACRQEKLDRPPVWVMRQAGRYLPEYRALKEKYTFIQMVQDPEMATEVTLQPLRRFDLDAAILFSDILVIPEAMGQPYSFREQGGIQMDFAVDSEEKIAKLTSNTIEEKLSYVFSAIELIKKELNGEKALIGFGGSPWTLATYMVEGGSSKSYVNIKSLFYTRPDLFNQLMEQVTEALITYFKLQIKAGVDVVQIFDSWGGVLSDSTFWDGSAKWMARIVEAIEGQVPVIAFSKGSHEWLDQLKKINADVLGLSQSASIGKFMDNLEGVSAVQGNLDPVLMSTVPSIVEQETKKVLDEVGGRPGHIFNLGHGILPDAKIENMETLVNTIASYRPAQKG